MPAIVGGTVGALAFTGILTALFFLRTRTQSGGEREPDLDAEKFDTQMIYTPFQPPPPVVNAMPMANQPPANAPLPALFPEIQDDSRGAGASRIVQPGTLMSTVPTAANRFAPPVVAPPFPAPMVLSDVPSQSSQSALQADTASWDPRALSSDPMEGGSLAPSTASSAPLLSQFGVLTDNETTEIAQLIHHGVSVPDAMRILEDKRKLEHKGFGGSFASTSAGGGSKSESSGMPDLAVEASGPRDLHSPRPPAYGFEI